MKTNRIKLESAERRFFHAPIILSPKSQAPNLTREEENEHGESDP